MTPLPSLHLAAGREGRTGMLKLPAFCPYCWGYSTHNAFHCSISGHTHHIACGALVFFPEETAGCIFLPQEKPPQTLSSLLR